jgi:hypothetical protein
LFPRGSQAIIFNFSNLTLPSFLRFNFAVLPVFTALIPDFSCARRFSLPQSFYGQVFGSFDIKFLNISAPFACVAAIILRTFASVSIAFR